MKDNSTGKDKEFYALGKKMFDRIQVSPEHQAMIQRGVDRTTPPAREWVGLTDDDIDDAWEWSQKSSKFGWPRLKTFAEALDKKLKKKNT